LSTLLLSKTPSLSRNSLIKSYRADNHDEIASTAESASPDSYAKEIPYFGSTLDAFSQVFPSLELTQSLIHSDNELHASMRKLTRLQEIVQYGLMGLVQSSTLVLAGVGLDLQPKKLGILGFSTLLGSSLACGISDFLSRSAEQDFLNREWLIERKEVEESPEDEKKELIEHYEKYYTVCYFNK